MVQAQIPLSKNGKPVAEIVVDSKADEVLDFASQELQHWIKEISGAKLPIVNKPGKMEYKIFLQVNPENFKDDLKKMQGNDGYAVRAEGNNIYLFASKSKGILNGVFKLLFRNTDIIWARPNLEYGAIFSKNPDLVLTKTDYVDIPVYILRGWQMIGPHHHLPSELWQIRNGSNWSGATIRYNPKFIKFGNVFEYGGGHNLTRLYIPEGKYFKEHPDFFPMIGGKRAKPSKSKTRVQLCFTNPEMTKAFIRELDEKIKVCLDYDTYRIMIEDNYSLCECPECLKPIKLANGETIDKDREAFRSTQFFMWLNKIAKYMQKHHPGKQILTFAYFFTEVPPCCKVEPNISISFCPIYKNSKKAMNTKENETTNAKFTGWLKSTNNLTLREYFGLTAPFPRPIDVIAVADWRYANKQGINKTYSEMYADATGSRMDGIKTWNLNSLYFWTMTNAAWNPYLDLDSLRKEFLKRVYGEAADDVGEFYKLTEEGWHKAGGTSKWNDKSGFLWRNCVREQNLLDKCRESLEKAARKITEPKAKKMLEGLRETFEEQIKLGKAFSLEANKVNKTPVFDPDFNIGEWKNVKSAQNFYIPGNNRGMSREKTAIKVLYDNSNIYFGIKCFDSKPDEAYARPAGQARDRWPAGDKLELFVTGYGKEAKVTTNQLVFDINGNIFDSQDQNKKWNCAFKLQRKTTRDGWSALLTLPFKELAIDLNKKPKPEVKVMFIRYWNHKSQKSETSFWEQGIPHNYQSFGNLIFN
jgi:hypothetical protein